MKGNQEDMELGSTIGLWSRYLQAESNMLLDRTCLMVDYQSCNRALDKAKPNRKEAVSTHECIVVVALECSGFFQLKLSHLFSMMQHVLLGFIVISL